MDDSISGHKGYVVFVRIPLFGHKNILQFYYDKSTNKGSNKVKSRPIKKICALYNQDALSKEPARNFGTFDVKHASRSYLAAMKKVDVFIEKAEHDSP